MCGLAALLVLAPALIGCARDEPEPIHARIPADLQTRFYPPPGWTWGSLRVEGAPPLRYGVGVQPRMVRASVLILPGYAEPAEAWFETAGELIGDGYAVWILDLAGQGGSGRWISPRDKGHAPSMDANVAAVGRMVTEVVRPSPERPLVLMGSDLGGQIALRAAGRGLAGVDALVLSVPSLSPWPLSTPRPLQSIVLAKGASLLGFDRNYAPGQGGWDAAAPRREDAGRRLAVPQIWMRANPELRTGGVTWGWIKAYGDSVEATRGADVDMPTMVLDRSAAGERLCARLRACRYVAVPSGLPPHLAEDGEREPWRRAVEGFIATRGADVRTARAP